MALPEGAPPTKEQVFEEVRATMQAEFGLRLDDLHPTTHLISDLDLDSIDLVDFAASVEESLGLSFREEELGAVEVVQDVVDLIHGALVARHAGAG